MIQFAIVIPFRPKAESVDWKRESDLLRKTVQSILQQTYAGFQVYVVYTDIPENPVTDIQVHYIEFPFGHKSYEEIDHREELLLLFKSAKMVVRRWDKARKLTYGSKLAKEASCDYIMALDADDMLSNRFLAFLATEAKDKNVKGWYMDKGYLFKEYTNYLMRISKHMRYLNGSTHVLHADLVKIPDFNSDDWQDYNLFTDHGWVKQRVLDQQGAILQPIPFAALVYVVHDSNISKVNKKEYGLTFKNIIKKIVRGVWLSNKLRNEFGIGVPRAMVQFFITEQFLF